MAAESAADEYARLAALAAARRALSCAESDRSSADDTAPLRSDSPLGATAHAAEQTLHPNRLSLRRRLLDARFPADRARPNPFIPRFVTGVNALDRMRDAPPAVVVALFEQHMLLEPGAVGPIVYDDPVAREILAAVNGGRLPPALLATVRRAGGALYDGAAVVGVVDYRSWAFATHGTLADGRLSTPVHPSEGGAAHAHAASAFDSRPQEAPQRPPSEARRPHEMHKVLLHTGSAGLSADIHSAPLSSLLRRKRAACDDDDEQTRIAFEARVLVATAPTLCLDPEPAVGRRLQSVHRALSFPRACLSPAFLGTEPHAGTLPVGHTPSNSTHGLAPAETVLRTLHADETTPTTHAERFVRRLLRPVAGGTVALPGAGAPANARFRVLHAAEDGTSGRARADSTPHYGLDARKDPARLGLSSPPSSSGWLSPSQQLYRTLRFESRAVVSSQGQGASPPVTHHTLHVAVSAVASPLTGGAVLARFEARIRIGRTPCTNDAAAPARTVPHAPSPGPLVFATGSRAAVDAFVESFRTVMAAEGRQCVADVSNSAIAGAVAGGMGLAATPLSMHGAGVRPRTHPAQRPAISAAPRQPSNQPFPRPR